MRFLGCVVNTVGELHRFHSTHQTGNRQCKLAEHRAVLYNSHAAFHIDYFFNGTVHIGRIGTGDDDIV